METFKEGFVPQGFQIIVFVHFFTVTFVIFSKCACKGSLSGPAECPDLSLRSPGFGLTLVAETTNGTFLSAELVSNPQGQGSPMLPEDLGRNCAKLLLEEIYRVSSSGPLPVTTEGCSVLNCCWPHGFILWLFVLWAFWPMTCYFGHVLRFGDFALWFPAWVTHDCCGRTAADIGVSRCLCVPFQMRTATLNFSRRDPGGPYVSTQTSQSMVSDSKWTLPCTLPSMKPGWFPIDPHVWVGQGDFQRIHCERVGVFLMFLSCPWCKYGKIQTSVSERQPQRTWLAGETTRSGNVCQCCCKQDRVISTASFLRVLRPACSTQTLPLI